MCCSYNLNYKETIKLINFVNESGYECELKNSNTNRANVICKKNDVLLFKITLGILLRRNDNKLPELNNSETPNPYLILLMRSGNSALAYFEEGKPVYHKVIRKYMVRKKQGKSQITYLKTKGKSRLGSRIRLAQAKQFFIEINEKLNEWDIINNCEYIFYACPVRMWPMLFKAEKQPPFNRNDERLVKLPLDIKTPNTKELKRVNYHLLYSKVEFEKELLDDTLKNYLGSELLFRF